MSRVSPSIRRRNNRRRRVAHNRNQLQYLSDLPNFRTPPLAQQQQQQQQQQNQPVDLMNRMMGPMNNFLQANRVDRHQPTIREYLEAFFSSMLSHIGLNLTSAEQMVNLINNINHRYSEDPVILPNIRYFWEKRAKSSDVNVYVLCDDGHAHGPYFGEPKDYKPFNCNGKDIIPKLKENKFFLHLPLRKQLEKHLPSLQPSAWLDENASTDTCNDVSNGKLAKQVKESGRTDSVKKLTLSLHADEVVAGNSSSIKIFPIFISLNELKPLVRKKHFFLVGLFVGKTKPKVEIYLDPICKDLESLAVESLTWYSLPNALPIKATFHVTCVIADAPMRAYLRNVRQYNHLNGCDWCLIQASSTEGHNARLFHNLSQREIQDLRRTKDDFRLFKEYLASENRELGTENLPRFRGLIGISPLNKLNDLDIVNGFSVEPMHCIILGIFRAIIMKGWLGDEGVNIFEKPYNKTSFKKELSSRIVQISVPSDVNRIPRDLDQIRYWKSAEYENFLAYYLFPTIKGLLKPRVINHLCCLIRIYHQASHGNIHQVKLQEIRNLIEEFQQGTAEFYGLKLLTYNLHILAHLPDCLENNGPCRNISSYPLESYMGVLKEKVRRYSNIAPSLVRSFISDFKYCEIIESKLSNWQLTVKELKDFGVDAFDPSYQIKITIKKMNLPGRRVVDTLSALEEATGQPVPISSTFCQSITVNGIRYSSREYCKDKQRDDSTLKTSSGDYLSVEYIIRTFDDNFLFYGQKIQASPVNLSFKGSSGQFQFGFDHILEVSKSFINDPVNIIVPYEEIFGKCIYIESTKFHYKYKKNYIVDQFLRNY